MYIPIPYRRIRTHTNKSIYAHHHRHRHINIHVLKIYVLIVHTYISACAHTHIGTYPLRYIQNHADRHTYNCIQPMLVIYTYMSGSIYTYIHVIKIMLYISVYNICAHPSVTHKYTKQRTYARARHVNMGLRMNTHVHLYTYTIIHTRTYTHALTRAQMHIR